MTFLLCTAAVAHGGLRYPLSYKLQKVKMFSTLKLHCWQLYVCSLIVHVLLATYPWQTVLCFQNNSFCCWSPCIGHIRLCVTMCWIISVLQSPWGTVLLLGFKNAVQHGEIIPGNAVAGMYVRYAALVFWTSLSKSLITWIFHQRRVWCCWLKGETIENVRHNFEVSPKVCLKSQDRDCMCLDIERDGNKCWFCILLALSSWGTQGTI